MRATSAALREKAVTLHNAAGSLAAPSGAPAAELSILDWRSGSSGPRLVRITLDAGNADNVVPGPVKVLGYDPVDAKWRKVATLEGGADLVFTSGLGYAWHFYDLPAWASALQLYSASSLTGTTPAVTSKAMPFELDGAS